VSGPSDDGWKLCPRSVIPRESLCEVLLCQCADNRDDPLSQLTCFRHIPHVVGNQSHEVCFHLLSSAWHENENWISSKIIFDVFQRRMENTAANDFSLPPEIILLIFAWLSDCDLIRASLACKVGILRRLYLQENPEPSINLKINP
jgi:hypothetical protein